MRMMVVRMYVVKTMRMAAKMTMSMLVITVVMVVLTKNVFGRLFPVGLSAVPGWLSRWLRWVDRMVPVGWPVGRHRLFPWARLACRLVPFCWSGFAGRLAGLLVPVD